MQIRPNEKNEHYDGLRSHAERDNVRCDARNLCNFGSTSNGNWHQGAENSGGLHAFRIRKRDSICESCADRRNRNEETEKAEGKRIEVAREHGNEASEL